MSDGNMSPPGSPPGDAPPGPPPGAPPGPAPSSPPPGGAPPPPPGSASENRQLFLVLAYLWILALIPFLIEKNDREVQWHAKHGLVLTVAGLAAHIAIFIVTGLVAVIPFLGCLGASVGCILPAILAVAQLGVHVYCIIQALDGKRFLIPGVSHFADQF